MAEGVVEGACLCGAVRFEVGGPLDRVAHCHCTICQRAHGAAFVTWAAVPAERLRITAGERDAGWVEITDPLPRLGGKSGVEPH